MINISKSYGCLALTAFVLLIQPTLVAAAPKIHVITFGKWAIVHCSRDSIVDTGDDHSLVLKVRPLLVDGRAKEFTVGAIHDVTDHLFVVRRAFRVNDSLPDEPTSLLHWEWQQGGWLLVDRLTGRISAINLPEFDAVYSAVSWYRDYAAYCGLSDDSKQIYGIVVQINRRKPIVKWVIGETKFVVEGAQWRVSNAECKLPGWQRDPPRVTFEPNPTTRRTYVVRGLAVDLLPDEKEDEEALK